MPITFIIPHSLKSHLPINPNPPITIFPLPLTPVDPDRDGLERPLSAAVDDELDTEAEPEAISSYNASSAIQGLYDTSKTDSEGRMVGRSKISGKMDVGV
jgi:hypothetical protein